MFFGLATKEIKSVWTSLKGLLLVVINLVSYLLQRQKAIAVVGEAFIKWVILLLLQRTLIIQANSVLFAEIGYGVVGFSSLKAIPKLLKYLV